MGGHTRRGVPAAATGRALGRRSFLAAAGIGITALAACGRAEATTAGAVTTATYIPKSYDDLYPGIQTFMDTLAARSGGRLTCDMYNAGTLLGAEQLLPGLLLGVADVMFQTSSYVSSSFPILGAMELPFGAEDYAKQRSEERRVGKGCRCRGGR